VHESDIELRIRVLSQALRERGLRVTHQRLEVVRVIASTDEHPDVETVYRAVRERVPTISLDTVYRTLATLADGGLVRRVTATTGVARYDANTDRHHHFVCERCGLIRDIADTRLDAIAPPSEAGALGVIDSVEVNFRGLCARCATTT